VKRAALFVGALTGASFASAAAQDPAIGQDPGTIVAEVSLPAADAAYHGGTHAFLDGRAMLTCSSHGGFTSSVDPPQRPGRDRGLFRELKEPAG
jgi:hypothetical protein